MQKSCNVGGDDERLGSRKVDEDVWVDDVSICPVAHESENQKWDRPNRELQPQGLVYIRGCWPSDSCLHHKVIPKSYAC